MILNWRSSWKGIVITSIFTSNYYKLIRQHELHFLHRILLFIRIQLIYGRVLTTPSFSIWFKVSDRSVGWIKYVRYSLFDALFGVRSFNIFCECIFIVWLGDVKWHWQLQQAAEPFAYIINEGWRAAAVVILRRRCYTPPLLHRHMSSSGKWVVTMVKYSITKAPKIRVPADSRFYTMIEGPHVGMRI